MLEKELTDRSCPLRVSNAEEIHESEFLLFVITSNTTLRWGRL